MLTKAQTEPLNDRKVIGLFLRTYMNNLAKI